MLISRSVPLEMAFVFCQAELELLSQMLAPNELYECVRVRAPHHKLYLSRN